MAGLVIVSHSRKLAEGIAELADQMTQGRCALAIAGGVDDDEHPIGTDAIKVMAAIEEVYDDSGVLVLMDMGSALLSTEMALELLDPTIAENVRLCSAPVVEGAMAAAVAASAGLSVDEMAAEAKTALTAKKEQLSETDETDIETLVPEIQGDCEFSWVVQNPHGLHARPAASLVSTVASFDVQALLYKEGEQRAYANARSLNSIAALGVRQNDTIRMVVTGAQAKEAIDAFRTLAQQHFGEDIHIINPEEGAAKAAKSEPVQGAITGQGASEGIVSGRVMRFSTTLPELPERDSGGEAIEWERFALALDETIRELKKLQLESEKSVGAEHAGIFHAQALMLDDPDLQKSVQTFLIAGHNAEQAWVATAEKLAEQYRTAQSEYMQQRATDVIDIARRLLSHLVDFELPSLTINQPVILLAEDLTPSDTAGLDPDKVLGLCLSGGGKTSHSAILARALGIPAIVRAEGCLQSVTDGQEVILDGFNGLLWLTPSDQTRQTLSEKRTQWLERVAAERQAALEDAVTLDGFTPSIMANIGKPEDVEALNKAGAQGVGLLRTEFLFLNRDTLPSEDEQYEVYSQIAAGLKGHALVIRTLDIGGDKPLPSIQSAEEENPFLGCRGLRLCLEQPELFKSQLKAIIRAAEEYTNIQIMFPMVATVAEFRQAKALLDECRKELQKPVPQLATGIMIEVPAAVFNARALAKEVDFFSIGTNDLTQYVMAADRGNPAVAELVDYYQPAVLAAISETCKAAEEAGIPVGMCGEMAAEPELTPLLLGLGVSKLSASSPAVPAVKASVRRVHMDQAKNLATRVLTAQNVSNVKQIIQAKC